MKETEMTFEKSDKTKKIMEKWYKSSFLLVRYLKYAIVASKKKVQLNKVLLAESHETASLLIGWIEKIIHGIISKYLSNLGNNRQSNQNNNNVLMVW